MTNYNEFQLKISRILRKSKNYHENAFTAFSPKSDESLSSAFSRLVRIFKQAYCDNQRDIHENEKNMLVSFYISKLNPRLRQLLQAEKTFLDFSTVASRAEELQTIYNLKTSVSENFDFINAINSIDKKKSDPKIETLIEKLINEIQSSKRETDTKFEKLIDSFRTNSVSDNRRYKNHNSKAGYFNGVMVSDLRGFCAFEILGRGCNRKDFCKYKHDNAPKDVINLKK